ncbi:MAG: hypothetical protein JW966_09530 [Anaerolineae bacterium]|nr:hypothetical protein [Anaerolineae bacterium]
MDRTSRSIVIGLVGVLAIAVLAIIVALLVPFQVKQPGSIRNIEGVVELKTSGNGSPQALDPEAESYTFDVDQSLRVQPGGRATVTFIGDGSKSGRAVLSGPATLALRDAYRQATLLGHVIDSDRFDREYSLTLEQTSGDVRYFFDNTSPPFSEINITIQLPTGSYSPSAPCWVIVISADGQVTTEDIDCTP